MFFFSAVIFLPLSLFLFASISFRFSSFFSLYFAPAHFAHNEIHSLLRWKSLDWIIMHFYVTSIKFDLKMNFLLMCLLCRCRWEKKNLHTIWRQCWNLFLIHMEMNMSLKNAYERTTRLIEGNNKNGINSNMEKKKKKFQPKRAKSLTPKWKYPMAVTVLQSNNLFNLFSAAKFHAYIETFEKRKYFAFFSRSSANISVTFLRLCIRWTIKNVIGDRRRKKNFAHQAYEIWNFASHCELKLDFYKWAYFISVVLPERRRERATAAHLKRKTGKYNLFWLINRSGEHQIFYTWNSTVYSHLRHGSCHQHVFFIDHNTHTHSQTHPPIWHYFFFCRFLQRLNEFFTWFSTVFSSCQTFLLVLDRFSAIYDSMRLINLFQSCVDILIWFIFRCRYHGKEHLMLKWNLIIAPNEICVIQQETQFLHFFSFHLITKTEWILGFGNVICTYLLWVFWPIRRINDFRPCIKKAPTNGHLKSHRHSHAIVEHMSVKYRWNQKSLKHFDWWS